MPNDLYRQQVCRQISKSTTTSTAELVQGIWISHSPSPWSNLLANLILILISRKFQPSDLIERTHLRLKTCDRKLDSFKVRCELVWRSKSIISPSQSLRRAVLWNFSFLHFGSLGFFKIHIFLPNDLHRWHSSQFKPQVDTEQRSMCVSGFQVVYCSTLANETIKYTKSRW